MAVRFHPHAAERMKERGAAPREVIATVEHGERFLAKFGRSGFRRNFPLGGEWHGKRYNTKQVEALAVKEGDDWLVLTVITRFF